MSEPTRSEDLAQRLKSIAQGRTSIDIAQLQFIGLSEIERQYGKRWPACRARIYEIARGFLETRIGPSDVLIEGADGFLVAFASKAGTESALAGIGLSQGLNDHFLGQGEDSGLRVGVRLRSAPAAELEASIDAIATSLAASNTRPAKEVAPGGLDWRFQPFWDVRRQALTSYYVVPYLKACGTAAPSHQSDAPESKPNYAAIDEAALRTSERALRNLLLNGQQCFIGVSVHVSSLVNGATRTRLLKAIGEFDRSLVRYRLLKIAGVPHGFPRLYLADIMGALRRSLPNIAIAASWDEPDLANLVHSGASSVGFTLSDRTIGPRPLVSRHDLMARVQSACRYAHASGKPFFVEGAFSPEQAKSFGAAGVDYLSSPQIWAAANAPAGVARWPAKHLAA